MAKSHLLTAKPNSTFINECFYTIAQIIGASLLMGLCAHIKIPLFFSPVPLTLQTFAVLIIAGVLGPNKAAASVLLYIGEGFIGLPMHVVGNLFGPTGGYLVGFLVQAYFVGWYLQKFPKIQSMNIFAVLVLSCFIQMSLGVLWLGLFVGWERVLLMGFYPFILGEVLKSLVAAKYLSRKS